MVMLCVVCAWHAIIAVCPTDVAPYWDMIALVSLGIIYTLFHIVFFLWMYFVVSRCCCWFYVEFVKSISLLSIKTYRRRRIMKRKDREYLVSRWLFWQDLFSFEEREKPIWLFCFRSNRKLVSNVSTIRAIIQVTNLINTLVNRQQQRLYEK